MRAPATTTGARHRTHFHPQCRDKNRRDIGKSQSKWTAFQLETPGSRKSEESEGGGARCCAHRQHVRGLEPPRDVADRDGGLDAHGAALGRGGADLEHVAQRPCCGWRWRQLGMSQPAQKALAPGERGDDDDDAEGGGQPAQRGAHRARSCAARPCSRSGWRGSESSAPTPVHVSGASCTRQQLCPPPPGPRGFRPPAPPTPCGLRTCQLERAVHIGRLPSGGDSAQQRTCCWTAATRSSWRSGVAVSSA
eukprot:COSAG01_NODE_3466_length_6056_cov_2.539198_8_plen_250_part_00